MFGTRIGISLVALAMLGAPASGTELQLEPPGAVEDFVSLDLGTEGMGLTLSGLFAPCRPCPKFGLSDLRDVPEAMVRLFSRGVYVDARPGDHHAVRIQVRPRGSGARVRVALRF